MGKSSPDPPDYAGAAEAQAQSSREVTEQQTWANRPTLNTPFGQQTWEVTPTWDPSTGQYINSWTQNTNLTPEAQRALDSQMDVQQGRSDLALNHMGRVEEEYGQPMDWSKFQRMSGPLKDQGVQRNISSAGLPTLNSADRYREDAENAIYGKFADRMNPQFERDQDRMRTQLYNTGLREGDEAYDQAMEDLNQQQGDQRQQAMYQSIIGGGQEASRALEMDSATRGQLFGERQQQGTFYNQSGQQAQGQQLDRSNFQNQLRQQQIAEEMQRRGFSLNEMNAILTGQQVGMPNMPSFNQAQRSEATQYNQAAQNQYQAQLDQFNAQQQGMQGLMGGAMQGAMMFSDRRLKKNITFIGVFRGLRHYVYQYVWGQWSVGVMSDEVDPKFVVRHPSGYDMVNYGALYG